MTFLKANNNLPFSEIESIRRFQNNCLTEHLTYSFNRSPYYRRLILEQGLADSNFDLNSLSKFPLTEKKHLEDFNDEFFAVAQENIIDMGLSSRATGNPIRIMYTELDLQRLAYNEKIALTGCSITKSKRSRLSNDGRLSGIRFSLLAESQLLKSYRNTTYENGTHLNSGLLSFFFHPYRIRVD